MALIIGTLLALLSLGVAIYPFARRRWRWGNATDPAAAGRPDGMESAAAAPDTASLADLYAALRTLQLEHELSRIPEGLYQEQLNDYRLQAALILRQQEQESAAANPANADAANADAALESEIQAARAALRQAAGNAAALPEKE